jgi:hypothetical protein
MVTDVRWFRESSLEPDVAWRSSMFASAAVAGRKPCGRMIGPLPHDLSRLSTGMRRRASDLRDRRVSMLLRRWPHSLTQAESRELVRLWDERIRLARHARPASSKRV